MRAIVTMLLVGAVGMLAGCAGVGAGRQDDLLLTGERAYEAERYSQAISSLTHYLQAADAPTQRRRALYVRAMAHAMLGRRQASYADLMEASQGLADRRLIWRVHAVLGVLRFEDEQWTLAARDLEKAVEAMPAIPPKDALLYRMGLCYERTGRWTQAMRQYERILGEFPGGPYVGYARRRVELGADHFAVQCGVFSSRESARTLRDQLRGAGLEAEQRVEKRGGRQLHVVVVGRYASYAEARRMLAQVRSYIPDAQLWP